MENCIFCKIVKKEIPTDVVYEDEKVLAFLDASPVNIGHSLVIPKEHFKNIYETPEEILGNMMKTVKILSHSIKKSLNADGINVTMNNDEAAGQVIFHSHIHIIPRIAKDGFPIWHGKRNYQKGEREEVAKKIISSIP